MRPDRLDCPRWMETTDGATLRRLVVAGCAVTWASVIGLLLT